MITPGHDTEDTLQARFEQFHEANPHVYATLERLAERWLASHPKVGTKMLWERLRWELSVDTTEHRPRLNNSYTSRYARLLLARHPEWTGRIETRQLVSA